MKYLVTVMLVLLCGSVFFQYSALAHLGKALEKTHIITVETQGNQKHVTRARQDLKEVTDEVQELKKQITSLEQSLAGAIAAQQSAPIVPTKEEILK